MPIVSVQTSLILQKVMTTKPTQLRPASKDELIESVKNVIKCSKKIKTLDKLIENVKKAIIYKKAIQKVKKEERALRRGSFERNRGISDALPKVSKGDSERRKLW